LSLLLVFLKSICVPYGIPQHFTAVKYHSLLDLLSIVWPQTEFCRCVPLFWGASQMNNYSIYLGNVTDQVATAKDKTGNISHYLL